MNAQPHASPLFVVGGVVILWLDGTCPRQLDFSRPFSYGEFCCGQRDCFVIPKERVVMTGEGYVIIQGPLAGMGPVQHEAIPFSEAQPSPDGEFWRCRRPDGSRRCFFAPTPLM